MAGNSQAAACATDVIEHVTTYEYVAAGYYQIADDGVVDINAPIVATTEAFNPSLSNPKMALNCSGSKPSIGVTSIFKEAAAFKRLPKAK